MSWAAYGDESIPYDGKRTALAYVVAAAMVEASVQDEIRDALASLDAKGDRLHWRHESDERKLAACRLLAQLPALHIVVAGMPVTDLHRDRALCLERLLPLLDNAGVGRYLMHARTHADNNRDVLSLRNCRAKHLVSSDSALHIEFGKSRTEAALVIAGIAAGAAGAAIKGKPEFLEIIAHLVEIHEIELCR